MISFLTNMSAPIFKLMGADFYLVTLLIQG